MLGFKRYLQEAKLPADYFAPWHITSQAEFDAISTDPSNDHYGAFMRNAKFNADGSVRITLKDYTTRGWDEVKGEHNVLPFKFSTGKNVEIKDVKSLWGAPDKAEELNINSVRLTSLEHLNIELNGYLFIEAPNATELKCSVTQKYSHTAVVFKEFKSFEKKDFMTSMQEIKKVGFRDATTEILKNTKK